jgi:MFS family permease
MNPAPSNVQHKTCFKCKYEGETAEKLCPRCRKRLRTRTEIRALGGVLAGLGAFLVVMMGTITFFAIGLVSQSGKPGTGARFTGTKDQMYLMFAIFGFVLLFGFTSLVAGMWQLIFGRRNMILIYVMLALGAIFLIGGSIFRAVVGD